MPATDSFTSSASVVSTTTGQLLAIDSFTSSALVDSSGTVALPSLYPQGSRVFTRLGWKILSVAAGVTITKAPALGGTQAAVSFPVTKNEAKELALALLEIS